MKFFPIKIAIVCLLATPILYTITLVSSEKYLTGRYSTQIQNILIGDSKPLLDGSLSLEEQIAKNIQRFLKQDRILKMKGLDLNILVTTSQGKILYPVYSDVNPPIQEITGGEDAQITAKRNFELLNNGLNSQIEAKLDHGSFLGNFILFGYFGMSFTVFLIFYRIGSSKASLDRKENMKLITELQKEDGIHKQILDELKKERQGLFENIKALNAKYQEDRRKASINEEEMFQEIVTLEEKFNAFIEFKQSKEKEIEELKSKIQTYERRKTPKIRRNEFDFILKRFSVIYKNIELNRKALTGFLNLDEDQQIKVEEIIHLLDSDPDKVIIKRKVFSGKKSRTTCFEVLFAYNGRLYFRKNENNRIEILTIGNKNTQTKDMEFIHNL
jgi:large-conductance mechanosensitive channel